MGVLEMKKTIIFIFTLGVMLTGCGQAEQKPTIGYSDKVNQELYSFEEVVKAEDYNQTIEDYSKECDGNDGVLLDEITKTDRGVFNCSFVCVEKN